MLERIQRDLFAIGARLADPAHRIAERVSEGGGVDDDVDAARAAGSMRSKRSCRRCDGSSSPGGSPGGATLHVARTVCRRAERAMVALGRDHRVDASSRRSIYVNRLSDLLFVMARARQPSSRINGTRVVSTHAPRATTPTRAAYSYCERVARQHYENFPVASFLLPAATRPHIAAVYAFARVADDLADEGDVAARGAARCARRLARPLLAAATASLKPVTSMRNVFLALSNTIRTCRLASAALCRTCSARSGRT